MNVIVSHVFSDANKGDAALLSVLLSDIRRAWQRSDITILTIDNVHPGSTFEGVPVERAFMFHALNRYKYRPAKFVYSLFVMGSTLIDAACYRLTGWSTPLPRHLRRVADMYRKADTVLPVGGGYLRGKPGLASTMELCLMLHPLVLARLLGKPTIHYSQSVGPFGNRLQAKLAAWVLRRVTLLIVREDITRALLHKLGVRRNVVRSIDSAFLLPSNNAKDVRLELGIPDGQLVVGITVRDWLKGAAQRSYENAVAALADHIRAKHRAAVVFIPQVTAEHHGDDDRKASARVAALMGDRSGVYVIKDHYDHKSIKSLYGGLDYLVGTRFHSVIFALTSYVPALAIEYEHKTRGILQDLELEKWVTPIEGVTADELITLFDALARERASYLKTLHKTLPGYVKQAAQTIELAVAAYADTTATRRLKRWYANPTTEATILPASQAKPMPVNPSGKKA